MAILAKNRYIWPYSPFLGLCRKFCQKWHFWPFFGLKMFFCPQKPFLVMQKCISYILDDYCSVKREDSQKNIFFPTGIEIKSESFVVRHSSFVRTVWSDRPSTTWNSQNSCLSIIFSLCFASFGSRNASFQSSEVRKIRGCFWSLFWYIFIGFPSSFNSFYSHLSFIFFVCGSSFARSSVRPFVVRPFAHSSFVQTLRTDRHLMPPIAVVHFSPKKMLK